MDIQPQEELGDDGQSETGSEADGEEGAALSRQGLRKPDITIGDADPEWLEVADPG